MFKNPLSKALFPHVLASPDIATKVVISAQATPNDPVAFAKAMALAKSMQAQVKTKIEIARAMYPLIISESKETIHLALEEGCLLTKKGAVTYRYNLIREAKKNPRHHLE